MTIPEEKLRELLALADKATPGRWFAHHLDSKLSSNNVALGKVYALANREHIAACSPDVVKAIVQELIDYRSGDSPRNIVGKILELAVLKQELLAARAEIARLQEGDDYCADCNTGLAHCCCGVRLG